MRVPPSPARPRSAATRGTHGPPLRRRRLREAVVALVTAACTLAMAGCTGVGTSGGFVRTGELAGPLAGVERLDGVKIAVGSKNYTEQHILGKIAVVLLRSAGADVDDLGNIPGSQATRHALVSGDTTVQWDYTGVAWMTYFNHTDPIPDPHRQWVAAAKEDQRRNDLIWLAPAPMNNTYGFAARAEVAKELGVTKVSDLSKVPPAKWTFCVEAEFANRDDGFEPMFKHYGLPMPPRSQIKLLDTGAIYAATADGLCTFGEVFTTDGRILSLNLSVLDDDRQYFPPYQLSAIVNGQLLRDNPQMRTLLEAVSAKLTNETLQKLNARVDVDGEEPGTVAYDWLVEEGFISPTR